MQTWTAAITRHAAGGDVEHLAALCEGIGVEAHDVDDLLFIAARLAALVDGDGFDWTWAVLQLREGIGNVAAIEGVAFIATWLGRYADLAALLIRGGLLPKLEPIVPPDMTTAEIEAKLREG
jgi:hypothetical protein